jgi:hypothetical protein
MDCISHCGAPFTRHERAVEAMPCRACVTQHPRPESCTRAVSGWRKYRRFGTSAANWPPSRRSPRPAGPEAIPLVGLVWDCLRVDGRKRHIIQVPMGALSKQLKMRLNRCPDLTQGKISGAQHLAATAYSYSPAVRATSVAQVAIPRGTSQGIPWNSQ